MNNRVSLLVELQDRPGSLHEILGHFLAHGINLTNIESRPKQNGNFSFYLDFSGDLADPQVAGLLKQIEATGSGLTVLDDRTVPWFPRHIWELDRIANRTLDAGTSLEADHPGFEDQAYREKRARIDQLARDYQHGQPIPDIEYTDEETATWQTVYSTLRGLHDEYACREYREIIAELEDIGLYSAERIPQAQAVNDFLFPRTGFRLRPVAGLLNGRDFLNGLAFRVFFCTQYLRHHSKPNYTPEPDICHELIGHAPMFADDAFADFSQEIGLASLGATDPEIDRLARCYWHSVEFGVIQTDSGIKAYGAGLLSSFGELAYACGADAQRSPEILQWHPAAAAEQTYPVTEYQPRYFAASSLNQARRSMREHCRALPKAFYARYVEASESIWVDRALRTSSFNASDNL